MKGCSIDGCTNAHRARGLCATHYNQQYQPNRHAKVEVPCDNCGTVCTKHLDSSRRYRFCDYACRDLYMMERSLGAWAPRASKPTVEPKPPRDMRSPLRRALEDGSGADVIAAIKADCDMAESGCWLWTRQVNKGYPATSMIGKTVQVHRLALEAKLGKPLGKQAAHHMCANSLCVNPDHLQPVTARENAAEMLARNYMESRIADLESALALHAPNHPLLREVGVVSAA